MTSQLNSMHGRNTLKNDIFMKDPKPHELQNRIEAMLAQFSPEWNSSQKVQETLARIDDLTEKIITVAGETRRELVGLYQETVIKSHLGQYESQVTLLEAQNRARIANLLGTPHDTNFTQTA